MELFQNAAKNLVREYQCFIDYLESNKVQLSKRTGHIGKKDCFAINRLFNIVCEKYQSYKMTQDYYTVIDFFYFFSVHTNILQITKKKGEGLTFLKSQKYDLFSKMSDMERYILMMTVWIGEYQEVLNNFYSNFRGKRVFKAFEGAKAGEVLSDPFRGRMAAPWGSYYMPEIRLLALFQLIHIEWLKEYEEDPENKFQIKELYQTAEGCFLIELLQKQGIDFWYTSDVGTVLPVIMNISEEGSDTMEEKLMNFWAHLVEIGLNTIEFKIQVGSCIREITMGDQFTLEDLHYLIQESVDFDSEHLYYFQIGSGTSRRRYFAPQCEDEIWLADTVSLTELKLYEGMQFEYLFDFGDEWHFKITVERILNEHTQEFEISRIKGEAPEQYGGDWW